MTNSREIIRDAVFAEQLPSILLKIDELKKRVPSTYLEETQIQDEIDQLQHTLEYMEKQNNNVVVVDVMPVHGGHAQPK